MDLFVKVFKALGEPTRLKILRILSVRPMYVCELESVLNISQPRISQHLRVLKEAGVLREAKEAQKTFYMLNGDIIERVFGDFIQFLGEDIGKLPGFEKETARIANLDSDSCVQSCKNVNSAGS
ncbi:MAG: metalloregulator ArsR/SmtB family transcription factor [Firmicutes bacterium]|nr:metalloregulator ArsR/SmtB family transcription factor [Bacillota bacterium]MCL5057245.1 metalloregulator ArsR/SmtB family transcription factor [Actinomycetota bacterium]